MVADREREPSQLYDPVAADLLAGMIKDMEREARRPLGDDLRIKAYNQAVLAELDDNEDFRDAIWNFTLARPEIGYTHATQLILRSTQNRLRLLDPDYPRDYLDQTNWREGFRQIFDNKMHLAAFLDNIHNRDVLSNIDDRFRSVRLLEHALCQAGRLENAVNIIDFGASRNHCLKKLKLAGHVRDLSFEGARAGRLSSNQRFLSDQALTVIVNQILSTPTDVEFGLGIDKISLADKVSQRFAEDCSFYPTELLGGTPEHQRRLAQYALLEESYASIPGIEFQHLDLLNPAKTAFLTGSTSSWGADIAVANTMLYQLSQEERTWVINLLEKSANENGIVIIQDFVEIDPDDPTRLRFLLEWSDPWLYKTVIKDMRDPALWQEVFLWDGGRCQRLARIAGELVMCKGEKRPVGELLTAA